MDQEVMPEGNWVEEKEINLKEFDDLCKKAFELKNEADALEEKTKEKKAELDTLKDRLLVIMKEHGKEKYPLKGFGTLYIKNDFTWRTPKTLEQKKEFFDYLKKKGILMDMVNVNSQTLNSFCKAELEEAKSRGEVEWNPPGLEQPSHVEKLNMRKG